MVITNIEVTPVTSGSTYLKNVSFIAPLDFIIPVGIYNLLVYYLGNSTPVLVFGKKVTSAISLSSLLQEE